MKYAEWRVRPAGTVPEFHDVDTKAARLLVATALAERGHDDGVWLDQASAVQLLSAYRLPIVVTEHVGSAEEAVAAAETIGYPVALKAAAPTFGPAPGRRPGAAGVGLGG